MLSTKQSKLFKTDPIALVDGNNFFVSCERLFRPDLNDKPVIVLSNNDGCAIARSNEAKALGIPMGAPFFKIKDIIDKHHVQVFSSNYILYDNISRRMVSLLSEFTQDLEVYSVDESFLNLKDYGFDELEAVGQKIHETLLKCIGIPSCVGIGPTKTLAKVANFAAKKLPQFEGYCVVMDEESLHDLLPYVPVGEIWGVGRQSAKKLIALGIQTAADLASLPLKEGRKLLTVSGEKIIQELNGVPCYSLEYEAPEQKNLAVTRSFGKRVTNKDDLLEALLTHTNKAAEKLRKKGLFALSLLIFIRTSPHVKSYMKRQKMINFPAATNDSFEMMKMVKKALDEIYINDVPYQKAGVICCSLVSAAEYQPSLLDPLKDEKVSKRLKLMDEMNAKMGPNTLFPLSTGIKKSWQMKSEKKSPNYVTDFDGLRIINADS
jgi:DNA polymerase V